MCRCASCGFRLRARQGPAARAAADCGLLKQSLESAPPGRVATKDWLWEIIGGTRVAHGRFKAADGSLRCERFHLDPEGMPSAYEGTVAPEVNESYGELELQFTYKGNPPTVSAVARIGKSVRPIECPEGSSGEWYLSEEACLDPQQAAPIHPLGCPDALSSVARNEFVRRHQEVAARLKQEASDAVERRSALFKVLARKNALWERMDGADQKKRCFRHVAKSNARDVRLYGSYLYPWSLHAGKAATVVMEQLAENDPYFRPGEVAIGCCGLEHYDLRELTDNKFQLREHRAERDDASVGDRPLSDRIFFFSKKACERD